MCIKPQLTVLKDQIIMVVPKCGATLLHSGQSYQLNLPGPQCTRAGRSEVKSPCIRITAIRVDNLSSTTDGTRRQLDMTTRRTRKAIASRLQYSHKAAWVAPCVDCEPVNGRQGPVATAIGRVAFDSGRYSPAGESGLNHRGCQDGWLCGKGSEGSSLSTVSRVDVGMLD